MPPILADKVNQSALMQVKVKIAKSRGGKVRQDLGMHHLKTLPERNRNTFATIIKISVSGFTWDK